MKKDPYKTALQAAYCALSWAETALAGELDYHRHHVSRQEVLEWLRVVMREAAILDCASSAASSKALQGLLEKYR